MTTITPKPLTEEQAMTAYRAVVGHLAATWGSDITAADAPVRQGEGDPAWYAGPMLVQDFSMWHSQTAWAVVWEGGPYEWPLHVITGLVPGVGMDSFCPFALSLYVDEPVVLP